MNTDDPIEIKLKLSATNQSGVIAALHLIANKFDVKVKDSLVSRVSRERSRVVVIFEGTPNASPEEFTKAIESHSRIFSIDDIEIDNDLSLYSGDELESDEDILVEEVTDFESIVEEVEKLESEQADHVGDELEYETEENSFPDIAAESESMGNMDLHYNENSPLKVARKISYKFNANDSVTDESLETTEQILIDLLGPVASLFVSTAVIEANSMGELFILLSEELDGEVKSNFLGLVKGIDKSQLELN